VTSNSLPSVFSIVLNNFLSDSRVKKQAESLASNGYRVTVVAMWEDGLETSETVSNFSVVRIKLLSKNWPRILPFQILKYLEFVIRSYFLVKKGHYIHCNDLDALAVGFFCKVFRFTKRRELKVIYDAHELETEVSGLTRLTKKVVQLLEKIMISRADAVITVCDSIAEFYANLYGISQPYVVRNIPR